MSGIAVILLAAGGSSRLGRPKQLLRLPDGGEITGEVLLRHSAKAAIGSSALSVLAVLGAEFEACAEALRGLPVEIVRNRLWIEGMASSLQAGIAVLLQRKPQIEAAVIILCDQPFLTTEVINGLIEKFRSGDCSIAASEYADGTPGAPVLFAASRFAELLALKGDQGARKLLRREDADTAFVPFPQGGIDIDTPADLERLKMEITKP